MFSEHLHLIGSTQLAFAATARSYTERVESDSLTKRKKEKNNMRCECEGLPAGFRIRFVFSSVSTLRGNTPLMCVRMNVWPYCPSCCLLSQITFWHSSLLSESLQWLWPKASGGPNDKASLTISRQEHGGERGKLNCQGEKRGEEEHRREGWREGGGGDKGGCDPILQNGARHNLFIWCPSESPFPRSHCSADLPPSLWHPFPFVCLPSVLLSLVTTFPLF